jgi:hypothetical protein
MTVAWLAANIGRRQRLAVTLFGDGFPDQLGDVDDQIGPGLAGITGRADLVSCGLLSGPERSHRFD